MINLFKKSKLKRELKKKMQEYGFPYIKVKRSAIKEYRNTTNKNKSLDNSSIAFKIMRAYYSGHETSINDHRTIVEYGYLIIENNHDENKITRIHNSKTDNRNGKINFLIKDKITSIYKEVFGGDV